MVYHYAGFVLCVSSVFVTALRETGREFTDSSGLDRIASNAFGAMGRSIAQAAGDSLDARNKVLQEVSSMVEGVRSRGSNASEILNASESAMLKSVIGIIRTDIFQAMDEEHADDVADMMEGIRRAGECNTDMNGRIHHAGGDVRILFQSMNESRGRHMACRKEESGKYDVNETKSAAFENFKKNELEYPPEKEFLQEVDMHWLNDFFADEEWCVWFNRTQQEYLRLRAERDVAHADLERTRKWCNGNQTEFEEFSCNYKYAKTAACAAHSKCFNRSTVFYDETLARANLSEKSRKNAYGVGNIIIRHLKCMLGEETCNTTDDTNYSRYDFFSKPMPSMDMCTVVDAYPCSPAFMNGAYSNMPHGTSAMRCTPCNDTVKPKIDDGCMNTDGPGQVDVHGSKCSDYHKQWCGKYDVEGQFDSNKMCCICGGGRYPIPKVPQWIGVLSQPTWEDTKAICAEKDGILCTELDMCDQTDSGAKVIRKFDEHSAGNMYDWDYSSMYTPLSEENTWLKTNKYADGSKQCDVVSPEWSSNSSKADAVSSTAICCKAPSQKAKVHYGNAGTAAKVPTWVSMPAPPTDGHLDKYQPTWAQAELVCKSKGGDMCSKRDICLVDIINGKSEKGELNPNIKGSDNGLYEGPVDWSRSRWAPYSTDDNETNHWILTGAVTIGPQKQPHFNVCLDHPYWNPGGDKTLPKGPIWGWNPRISKLWRTRNKYDKRFNSDAHWAYTITTAVCCKL